MIKMATKIILAFGLTFSMVGAQANDDAAKIAFAKKVVIKGEISPYATPQLKSLLKKAHQIDERMAKHPDYEGMGCEFAEHFYLGHGNGGLEAQDLAKWQAKVLPNGTVRATFTQGSERTGEFFGGGNLVELDLVAYKNSYAIHDVRFAFNENPRKMPTKANDSIRLQAQKMVNKNSCVFEQ